MNRVQKKLIIDALENEDLLTEWEAEFINNLADHEDDYKLSDRQNAMLNRISQKINKGLTL